MNKAAPGTNEERLQTRQHRPTRHFRLVCWRLLYHVDVQKTLDRPAELVACEHARLPIDKWDAEKVRCRREWDKLLAKRERRHAWFKAHGSVPDGWTPPDPKDPRRTANRPIRAYLARRGLTLEQALAKYSLVRAEGSRGKPDRQVVSRLAEWLKNR
jgi:hypothetical protein